MTRGDRKTYVPGSDGILAEAVNRHDVVKSREVGPDPSTSVILVGNGVHPDLAHEGCELLLAPLIPDLVQSLGQHVGSTPGKHPERLLAGIYASDQRRRGIAGSWLVQCSKTVHGMSGDELGCNLICGRVRASLGHVAVEVVDDLAVAVKDAEDGRRVDGVVLPGRGDDGDVDDVKLVRVGQEAHETHLVVRLVGDVRHDEHARLVLILGRLAQAFALAGPDGTGERREGKAGYGEEPPEGESSTTHCCYGQLVNMGQQVRYKTRERGLTLNGRTNDRAIYICEAKAISPRLHCYYSRKAGTQQDLLSSPLPPSSVCASSRAGTSRRQITLLMQQCQSGERYPMHAEQPTHTRAAGRLQ